MKKLALYAGALLAACAFTACDEDFTDWADPQQNQQEAAAEAVNLTMQAVPTATIDREQAADSVDLVALGSIINSPEGSVAKFS